MDDVIDQGSLNYRAGMERMAGRVIGYVIARTACVRKENPDSNAAEAVAQELTSLAGDLCSDTDIGHRFNMGEL